MAATRVDRRLTGPGPPAAAAQQPRSPCRSGAAAGEELTERDLDRLRGRYAALGRAPRDKLLRGLLDTGTPAVPAVPAGRDAAGRSQ